MHRRQGESCGAEPYPLSNSLAREHGSAVCEKHTKKAREWGILQSQRIAQRKEIDSGRTVGDGPVLGGCRMDLTSRREARGLPTGNLNTSPQHVSTPIERTDGESKERMERQITG